MTREEAITILNMVEAHGSIVIQAKDMAIEALEQGASYETTIVKLTQVISEQEPKIGHWMKQDLGYKCSNCTLCTNEKGRLIYNYCPNCGVKMESEAGYE